MKDTAIANMSPSALHFAFPDPSLFKKIDLIYNPYLLDFNKYSI